jgi:hypothetical protein
LQLLSFGLGELKHKALRKPVQISLNGQVGVYQEMITFLPGHTKFAGK